MKLESNAGVRARVKIMVRVDVRVWVRVSKLLYVMSRGRVGLGLYLGVG